MQTNRAMHSDSSNSEVELPRVELLSSGGTSPSPGFRNGASSQLPLHQVVQPQAESSAMGGYFALPEETKAYFPIPSFEMLPNPRLQNEMSPQFFSHQVVQPQTRSSTPEGHLSLPSGETIPASLLWHALTPHVSPHQVVPRHVESSKTGQYYPLPQETQAPFLLPPETPRYQNGMFPTYPPSSYQAPTSGFFPGSDDGFLLPREGEAPFSLPPDNFPRSHTGMAPHILQYPPSSSQAPIDPFTLHMDTLRIHGINPADKYASEKVLRRMGLWPEYYE